MEEGQGGWRMVDWLRRWPRRCKAELVGGVWMLLRKYSLEDDEWEMGSVREWKEKNDEMTNRDWIEELEGNSSLRSWYRIAKEEADLVQYSIFKGYLYKI